MKPVFILGATASGKHEVALAAADLLGAEIVSMDSMKVYRGMDIGTAKPGLEERARVPHHLVDICDPSDAYNAGRFVRDAEAVQAAIESRGRRALFVGGTALYYKAYVYGLFDGPAADPALRQELVALGAGALHGELSRVDPNAARRIHPNDLKRLVRAVEVWRKTGTPISARQTQFGRPSRDVSVFCLWREKEDVAARIARRVGRMLRGGLVEETRRLLAAPWSREGRGAVGYREVADHLEGRCAIKEVEPRIVRDTGQFARKQRMWFRTFQEARAIPVAPDEPASRVAARITEIA